MLRAGAGARRVGAVPRARDQPQPQGGGGGEADPAAAAAAVPHTTPLQRAFWQAITLGDMETVRVLLTCRGEEIDVNRVDEHGEQRQGCTALHLALLEMPTWKFSSQQGNHPHAAPAAAAASSAGEFVKRFVGLLLDQGADMNQPCAYPGEWYLQTAQGKTKSFYPDGYDALGLVLQFVEITRGAADVVSSGTTRRLELLRDLLLTRIQQQHRADVKKQQRASTTGTTSSNKSAHTLAHELARLYRVGGSDRLLCDVELVAVGEHEQPIQAHKLVLASRSPVFAAMFTSGFAESSSACPRISIAQTTHCALERFCRFLYEDRLDGEGDGEEAEDFAQLCAVLVLGNRYQIPAVVRACSQRLLHAYLSCDTAAELLKLAQDNNAPELLHRVLAFAVRPGNLARLVANADFQQLEAELVQQVLARVASSTGSAAAAAAAATGGGGEWGGEEIRSAAKRARLAAPVHPPVVAAVEDDEEDEEDEDEGEEEEEDQPDDDDGDEDEADFEPLARLLLHQHHRF